jgi:5-methylthioadenosine/S-adenosylhomocysteine deaminase
VSIWNPSGSDDIFGELRVAEEFNEDKFENVIQASDWIKMITVNPAKALALDNTIGQLAPGFKADVTVLRSQNDDPHRSLLANHVQDIEMVWVGGELLYGRASVLQKVKPDKCEALSVHGATKRICVSRPGSTVPKASQTMAQIRTILLNKYAQLSPLVP